MKGLQATDRIQFIIHLSCNRELVSVLPKLFSEIVVPEAVRQEIERLA